MAGLLGLICSGVFAQGQIGDDPVYREKEKFLIINGFLESRFGIRTRDDPHQKPVSLAEIRGQLDTEKTFGGLTVNLTTDLIFDPALNTYHVDLESGRGIIDLRAANILFSPVGFMDVKFGRQVLTWGTGDLVFINDLFAKDWRSFLIGRDDEYLKAPSDALKLAMFFRALNIDLVYVPKFGADRFVDGRRLSFFDRASNSSRGRNALLEIDQPDEWMNDDELSIRLYRLIKAYEVALYYHSGFWKIPAGQDPESGRATFPEMQAYGISLRGKVGKGIANIEGGYYRSPPGAGADPLVRNSELRVLAGYEQEIATEFTAAVQYYLERKLDYDDYENSLPAGIVKEDKNRHVFTLRLTKSLMRQDLNLSLFQFYSPSDRDGYLRFTGSYNISDTLKVGGGANVFYGRASHTFYAQFRDNSNVYGSLRYVF